MENGLNKYTRDIRIGHIGVSGKFYPESEFTNASEESLFDLRIPFPKNEYPLKAVYKTEYVFKCIKQN